jgi:hypothetical protein
MFCYRNWDEKSLNGIVRNEQEPKISYTSVAMTTEDFMFMFFGSNDNRIFRVLQKQQETKDFVHAQKRNMSALHNYLLCYRNWDEKSLNGIVRNEQELFFRKQWQPKIPCTSEATRNKDFVHAQKRNMSALQNYLLCYRNWDEKSLNGIVRNEQEPKISCTSVATITEDFMFFW